MIYYFIKNNIHPLYELVSVLHREKKEGLGKAYIAGFKEALKMNPDYILQMDADFSHHPKYIPLFLKEISNCDIVLGSRFLNVKYPTNVSLLSLWANYYVKWILGLKITDGLGGFKCFHRRVIEEVPIIFFPRRAGGSKKSQKII